MFLLLLLLHRLMLIIPPPQKKKKNWKNCHFVLSEKFVKSAQNQSLSSEICPENFCEIGFLLTIVFQWNLSQIFREIGHFFCEVVSENPPKFDLYSVTYQRPCVTNSLRYKSSWSGHLFLSPSTFLPSRTSVMSNLDQSYLKKWTSELH